MTNDDKLRLVRESEVGGGALDFSKVAGMEDLKATLRFSIIEPLRNPALFAELGLNAGGKFILFGPPGCGKSFICRAVAGEAKARCYELFPSGTLGDDNPVGALQKVFQKARTATPSVVIIDEVESLTEKRESYSGSPWMRQFINEMLSQLDSTVHRATGVLVLGSTNSPWFIDGAFIRPGRFDQVIFVPPPDETARLQYLVMELAAYGISDEESLRIAESTEGYSCAELGGAIKRTKVHALQQMIRAGKAPAQAEDLVLSPDILRKEIESQVSSGKGWFDTFDSRASDLPEPMVKAVRDYRQQRHLQKLK